MRVKLDHRLLCASQDRQGMTVRCMNPVYCLGREQSSTGYGGLTTLDPDAIAAQNHQTLSSGQQAALEDGLTLGILYLSIWEVQDGDAIGFDLEIGLGSFER